MKYRVIAADPLYGRLLSLEIERLGFTPAAGFEDFALLAAEGQNELPPARQFSAAVLIGCGLLSASLPETVKVLILDRPFALTELREFAKRLIESDSGASAKGDGITLYPDELSVGYGDLIAKLTKREFELFAFLHTRAGEVLSRGELLREIWNDTQARDTNVVDVFVRFLRTKLDEPFGVKLIRAKRGEGYYYLPEFR